METAERILELLSQGRRPMSVRELATRLSLSGDARRQLKPILRRMIEDGTVVKIRGARIGLPERMNLVVGRLNCNPAGYGFVAPERKSPGPDVYVSAVNMKEALQGDRVVVRVERTTRQGPEGRIIRVLERALTRMVGRYQSEGGPGAHVVPFDRRVLHELIVPAGQSGGAEDGEMVVAEITRPPTASRNPVGRVLRVLGHLDEAGVDLKVVMAKYGLPEAFPLEVEVEAARVPASVRPEDLEGRVDFRAWPTITVDPEDARDHDDAISLDRLPDGGWRLGVHIADVAHYVSEGSALDQEAYLRGTSVYFPGLVVPMLPHQLSSGLCSLLAGEDRLVKSVVLGLDATGSVRSVDFHDAVIRSAARLSYQQAQAIVDGDPLLRELHSPLLGLIQGMDELAKLMRQRRYQRGSLDLDVPEPKLVLGPDGEMTGIVAGERLDSMRAIEEFMLAANQAVAERLSETGASALFRIHEQPDPERVEEFCELLTSFGYRVPPGSLEQVRPEDFQLILRQIEGKPEERLVSYLLLRTMKLARYHEANLGHFGLATRMYTHFTSPIRRYPDLLVHRALRASRGQLDAERRETLEKALPEMGRHLSEMERRASEAERELIEWKKVRFMAGKLGEVYSGYITGVQAYGLFVELEELFVQGMVHVSSMSDDYYVFNQKAHLLKGENTRQVYRLGDRVEVQVVRVDLERRQIDFALVDVIERQRAKPGDRLPPRASAGCRRAAPRAVSHRVRRPGRRTGRG